MIGDLYAGRVERGDGKLAVPFIFNAFGTVAFEHDALHRSRLAHDFANKMIVVSLIGSSLEITSEGAEPTVHVGPGKKDRNRDRVFCWIFGVPAINGDWIA